MFIKQYISILILLAISSLSVSADDWYKSKIEGTLTRSGYYNIELSQQLIATSNKFDFGDLRILDSSGKEVPYFVRSENPIKEINSFVPYKIYSSSIKDSLNTQIIDNSSLDEISRIYVIVRNAEASKYIQVRGSNDLNQWYIVKQQSNVSYFGAAQDNKSEVLVVDVPKGNYKYYELKLTTNQRSPIEVLKIGKFSNSNIYGQLSEIDLGRFSVKDSTDKRTYIQFPDLKYSYRISKLGFTINNKPDYYRNMSIETNNRRVVSLNISSKGSNVFFFDNVLISSDTRIVIDNNDNTPLVVDSIKAYGLNRYLCAYLNEGETYTVVVNSREYSQSAQYDLGHFIDDIPENLQILTTSQPVTLHDTISDKREQMWFERPVFLWSVIVLVGIFLLVVCLRMVKDLKKKRE